MKNKITGCRDGVNSRNEHYKYKGRTYPRLEMVRRVKAGLHDGYTTTKINGREYIKDIPDPSKKDNVNHGKR